jgi:hypothetical protein
VLGIVGRDWDTLTVEQEDRYLDWVEDYAAQMQKNAGKAGQ